MGTSRTIVVDPSEHQLLGGHQYRESLPLNDKEVVLTFDDGPLPQYSSRVLDILAQECVKATFFMVGRMARAYPRMVRRVYDEGHTLANHSQNHPFNFHRMAVADAAREIEGGFESIAAAIDDPAKVAPFFRFPGLLRQEAVEHYLASKQVMSWSVDFMADDWRRINAQEIVRRALERLEAKGKGILLLHDIRPATAIALPTLLAELKARGYRIVHVVPAGAERPPTATTADQWRVRQPPSGEQTAERAPNVWPRVLAHQVRATVASLAAPSVTSFGAGNADDTVPVALVPDTPRPGEAAPPSAWPEEVITIAALPAVEVLAAPAADYFRYSRIARSRLKRDLRGTGRETVHPAKTDATDAIGAMIEELSAEPKAAKPGRSSRAGNARNGQRVERPGSTPSTGHQIQIHAPRPQASLSPRS